jgi:hypothetical protein
MTIVASQLLSRFRRHSPVDPTIDGVHVLRHGRTYDPAWDRWRPTRRWPGVILSAIATAGLLTAIAYHYEKHATAAPRTPFKGVSVAKLSPAYFPPILRDSVKVTQFLGTGKDGGASNIPLTSSGGLSSWLFRCECRANFVVTVRTEDQTIVGVPANAIGSTRTVSDGSYPAGHYLVDVRASGPWLIDYVTEGGLPTVKVPFTYVSSGTSILGPFPATARKITLGYRETLGQLFTVQVVDANDGLVENALDTIRNAYEQVHLTNPPNPYFLIVSGSGIWLTSVT